MKTTRQRQHQHQHQPDSSEQGDRMKGGPVIAGSGRLRQGGGVHDQNDEAQSLYRNNTNSKSLLERDDAAAAIKSPPQTAPEKQHPALLLPPSLLVEESPAKRGLLGSLGQFLYIGLLRPRKMEGACLRAGVSKPIRRGRVRVGLVRQDNKKKSKRTVSLVCQRYYF